MSTALELGNEQARRRMQQLSESMVSSPRLPSPGGLIDNSQSFEARAIFQEAAQQHAIRPEFHGMTSPFLFASKPATNPVARSFTDEQKQRIVDSQLGRTMPAAHGDTGIALDSANTYGANERVRSAGNEPASHEVSDPLSNSPHGMTNGGLPCRVFPSCAGRCAWISSPDAVPIRTRLTSFETADERDCGLLPLSSAAHTGYVAATAAAKFGPTPCACHPIHRSCAARTCRTAGADSAILAPAAAAEFARIAVLVPDDVRHGASAKVRSTSAAVLELFADAA